MIVRWILAHTVTRSIEQHTVKHRRKSVRLKPRVTTLEDTVHCLLERLRTDPHNSSRPLSSISTYGGQIAAALYSPVAASLEEQPGHLGQTRGWCRWQTGVGVSCQAHALRALQSSFDGESRQPQRLSE